MQPLCATFEPLSWENQFFDVNSSLIRINDNAEPLTPIRLNRWSRVQAKIPAHRTDLLDSLQTLGFQFVEGEVDLCLPVEANRLPAHYEIAQEQHIDVLREQAARAFQQSRFRAPWYQPHDSGRFYAQWVENAVRGTFDHQCILLTQSDVIQGFVTLRQLNGQEARVGLLAGSKMGSALMMAAVNWCQQRGLTTLRVATQVSNRAALRLYIQCGAMIDSTAFWLYR